IEVASARENPRVLNGQIWIYAGLAPGLLQWVSLAIQQKVPLVVGTTGLAESEYASLQKTSREIPLFYSPNFSLGIALLKKLAVDVAQKFHPHAQVDLIETHHAGKRDAPSGTALWIAKSMEPRNCQIHSLRVGNVVGEHALTFNTSAERICLSHVAHDLSAFGRGALTAALFLLQQPTGFYTMEDLVK
ncbi:MAG: hypothetical protein HY069_02625, partial [Chlamydiia bacterium]|nr:hypothetical protein [Chlamydiia bacterium]